MRRKDLRNMALCMALGWGAMGGIKAQESILPIDTLTLQHCLDIGLLNNYAFRIAHNLEQISTNTATAANAGSSPTLGLIGSYRTTVDNTSTTLRTSGAYSTEYNVFY